MVSHVQEIKCKEIITDTKYIAIEEEKKRLKYSTKIIKILPYYSENIIIVVYLNNGRYDDFYITTSIPMWKKTVDL